MLNPARMKCIIMGIQGCGKGTQAKKLESRFNMVQISIGDMFRWNIKHHTKLGSRITRTIKEGNLVSDEVVIQLLRQRLNEHDWNFGFILDGFPRNRVQSEFLLETYDIDAVILLEVPDEEVLRRIMGRRHCPACGLDYNVAFVPPKVAETCDGCGTALVKREDDNEEAVRKRLNDYHVETQPLIDIFEDQGILVRVDGAKSPTEVQQEICERLGLA